MSSLHNSNPLTSGASVQCERAVRAYEEAWRRGSAPALDYFLPSTATLRLALLIELVHTDLELRLEAGQSVSLETYLTRYPELAADRAAVLDLLAAEYRLRRRREPELTPDEYVRRFPHSATHHARTLATPDSPAAHRPTPATRP